MKKIPLSTPNLNEIQSHGKEKNQYNMCIKMTIIFYAISIVSILFPYVETNEIYSHHFKNSGLQNLIFTSGILYENFARSKLSCAIQCHNDLDCMTFTFNKRSRSCQGHSKKMEAGDSYNVLQETG